MQTETPPLHEGRRQRERDGQMLSWTEIVQTELPCAEPQEAPTIEAAHERERDLPDLVQQPPPALPNWNPRTDIARLHRDDRSGLVTKKWSQVQFLGRIPGGGAWMSLFDSIAANGGLTARDSVAGNQRSIHGRRAVGMRDSKALLALYCYSRRAGGDSRRNFL
jgi:hypothetical protein